MRESRGWSQAALAAKSGVSQPTIVKLESGRTKSSRSLHQIAKSLGVTTEHLVDGSGSAGVDIGVGVGLDEPMLERAISRTLEDVQIAGWLNINSAFVPEDFTKEVIREYSKLIGLTGTVLARAKKAS